MMFGAPIWRGDGRINTAITKAIKLGFDFVEIDLETIKPQEIRLRRKPPLHGYHAPYTIHLAHQYQEVEKVGLKVLGLLMKYAERTGAAYLNIHLNFPHYRRLEALNRKTWSRAMRNLKGLARQGAVDITVENIPRHGWKEVKFFEEAVKIQGVSLCLDVGHLVVKALEKGDLEEAMKVVKRWFRKFRGKIGLVHLHNVYLENGRPRDHVAEGILELGEILDMAERNRCGRVLLETFVRRDGGEMRLEDMAMLMRRLLKR